MAENQEDQVLVDEQEQDNNETNSIKEHTTKQTMGAGLAGMKDDL